MANSDFSLQLMDTFTGKLLQTSGGKFIVTVAGSPLKKTLVNQDSAYASLSNPITPTYGRLRFAVAGVSPVEVSVDIYGFTGDGRYVVARGVTPQDSELWVGGNRWQQMAVIPLHITDYPATVETDTGLDFTTGMVIDPNIFMKVTTADATETLDVGLLSSESGGDADGFLAALDVGTAGTIVSKIAATATVGALLKENTTDSGSQTSPVRKPYAIGATAVSLTFTTTAGSDTLQGYVCIPYSLPAA